MTGSIKAESPKMKNELKKWVIEMTTLHAHRTIRAGFKFFVFNHNYENDPSKREELQIGQRGVIDKHLELNLPSLHEYLLGIRLKIIHSDLFQISEVHYYKLTFILIQRYFSIFHFNLINIPDSQRTITLAQCRHRIN